MLRTCAIVGLLCAFAARAVPAFGQTNIPGYDIKAYRHERIGEKHWMLTGSVELEQGDTKLYADEIEVFEGEDSVLARGNVLFTQGNSRIAADRAEFNTRTGLGTFHTASGISSMQPPRQAPTPGGIIVPQAIGQDTDVYFFGETVEKISAKKYRIKNGGFSTCVQPTPRWNLSADTVVLNIDDYTLLRQAIFTVKGVPMLYLPILYYPTQEDGRATGFLLPTYSHSTIDGHAVHNAFFWAISRSMDATVFHDYLSATGGRLGTEYRYNLGGGSDGTFTASGLDERAGSFRQPNGIIIPRNARRSYMINGGANQLFPGRLRGRVFVDYFSSIVTNQTYNTDINVSTNNNRRYGGNIVGAWGTYSLNGTFDRSEWFSSTTSSALTGSSPRMTLSRNERPLFPNGPLYMSMTGEIAHLDRVTNNAGIRDDRSLGRLDFLPQIRFPFKKWQWFTVNTSASWRETFYSRSLDLETNRPIDTNVNRQYFTVQAQAVGPVFTKVWDTPESDYAERFKHTIEPVFTVQRTSSIDEFARIVKVDGTDTVFGTATFTYGLNNRIYAKRRVGQLSLAQEIVAFEVAQSYYANAQAAQFDPRYNTNIGTGSLVPPSNFSPMTMSARVTPSPAFNASLRGEIDSRETKFRGLSVNGSYNIPQRLTASVGWSKRFFVESAPGYNNKSLLDQYLNLSGNLQTRDNKYGTTYSANYDVLRSRLLQQSISAFYNAQCCGIAAQYVRYDRSGISTFFVPADSRFFLSFTLAGLGNFSPVGGMNGGPGRR